MINKTQWQPAIVSLVDRLRGSGVTTHSTECAIQLPVNTDRALVLLILASLPAALVGIWHIGARTLMTAAGLSRPLADATAPAPDVEHIAALSDGIVAPFAAGLGELLPVLLVATLVSIVWELLFATARQRVVDPAWPMTSWLFALLIPHQTPLTLVAVGMSFGAVFGSLIFGGDKDGTRYDVRRCNPVEGP